MRNKSLLNISIICLMFLSATVVNAQEFEGEQNIYKTELENDTWISNKIIGLDTHVEKYELTKFVQRKFAGFLLYFKDDNMYISRYVAPCGNDFFTIVNGKYRFIDKDKISFTVDSVSYSGMDKRPTEYRKPQKILFKLSKQNDKIILEKIKE